MSCDPVAHISKCYDVKPNDQISLKNAVFQQPVAVAIEADTRYFQMYSHGVLDSSECGTKLDHGVLAVGYGEENGVKYWLVKNSWSTSWGEDGYVKIAVQIQQMIQEFAVLLWTQVFQLFKNLNNNKFKFLFFFCFIFLIFFTTTARAHIGCSRNELNRYFCRRKMSSLDVNIRIRSKFTY